jgi:hypothetical protein
MKALLKLNKSILAIVIFTSSCFVSNYSHAQGLLGKIKKAQDDIKKTTDEAKKIKNDVKGVTGAGGNGGSDANSGSNGSSGNSRNSVTNGSDGNTSSNNDNGGNEPPSVIPTVDEDFVNKITVSNQTGRKIEFKLKLEDNKKTISDNQYNKYISLEVARDIVLDLTKTADRVYLVRNAEGAIVNKTVSEKGKYFYSLEAYFLNERGEKDLGIGFVQYNGDDLKKMGYVIKVEGDARTDAEFARKAKFEKLTRDANDPTKRGTLTIVNSVGGMGKIYCVLYVPGTINGNRNSAQTKKVEFMLGPNKGDKYVIKDLRLFFNYDLKTMSEAEKLNFPNRVERYIPHSLSGRSGLGSFRMEDGLIGNVGVRGED